MSPIERFIVVLASFASRREVHRLRLFFQGVGTMHVMVGDTRSARNIEVLKELGWGRMCNRDIPKPFPHEKWGYDNGCFDAHLNKRVWDQFAYLRRLDAAEISSNAGCGIPPYIAVTPDIVAGGLESLEFSVKWLTHLPKHWPWYLAVQDGMTPKDVEEVGHLFNGIFLGGSDRFKGQAQLWCDFAHHHGKKFHYGRAGTLRKVKHAYMVGADSCDSSFPLWTQERFNKFVAYCGGLKVQGTFPPRSEVVAG